MLLLALVTSSSAMQAWRGKAKVHCSACEPFWKFRLLVISMLLHWHTWLFVSAEGKGIASNYQEGILGQKQKPYYQECRCEWSLVQSPAFAKHVLILFADSGAARPIRIKQKEKARRQQLPAEGCLPSRTINCDITASGLKYIFDWPSLLYRVPSCTKR